MSEIQYGHRRMDRVERQLRKLYQAPTVPIYDMAAGLPTNHLLQINEPSLDDFSPILYWISPVPRDHAWLRVTYRPDVYGATDHEWFTPALVFKQYFDNQDYYGALGTGANYVGGAARAHDPGTDYWAVDSFDIAAVPGTPTLNHYWTGNPAVMDLDMEYTGTVGDGSGFGETTTWTLTLWVDETNMVAQNTFAYTADAGQANLDRIGGIVIINNYGDSAGSSYWDNISLGGSQGLDNYLATQTFESGFGAFLEADDGSGMRDSFAIVVDPT